MKLRTASACLLAAPLLTAAAVRAQAPKPILLKEASAVGDVAVVETNFTMEMDGKVSMGEQSFPFDMVSRQNQRYREERLSNGFRRTYAVASQYDKNPDGEKTRVSSLQGKTVAVRRVKGKVVVTVDKGKLDAEDRAEVADDLDSPHSSLGFFPAKPLLVGEEWTLDAKALRETFGKSLGKGGKAELRGRLEELTTRDGKPVARVTVKLHLERNPPGEPKMTLDLQGEMIHRTDIQRVVSADLAGTTTASGGDGALRMEGEGTAVMKWRFKPIKIGGKAVAP